MAAVLPLVPGKGFMRDPLVQHIPWSSHTGHEHSTFLPSSPVSTGLAGDTHGHLAHGCGDTGPCLAPVTPRFSQLLTGRGGERAPSRTGTLALLFVNILLELKPPWRPAPDRPAHSRDEDSQEPQIGRERAPQELICVDELPVKGDWNTGNASGSGMSFLSEPLARKSEEFKKTQTVLFTLPATKLIK